MRRLRLFILTCYTLLYIWDCNAQNILSYYNRESMEAWADSVLQTLTPDERLGQLIIPIVGNENTAEQRAIIKKDIDKYHIGGLLFSKGSLSSQESLTTFAQNLSSKVPLLITTDSEWGLFMRLTDAVRFPKNMALGCINHTINNRGSNLRDSLMYEYGLEVGKECRAMGISANFAPVLDVNNNPKNPVIGNRSFGDNYLSVSSAALSYSSGLEDAGVLAVGKHFPGHGDTDKDSHKTLPVLTHSRNRMETTEMKPFQLFAKAGFGGIMVGHLEVPSLEPTNGMPSSASKNIITGYLREKFGFNGLVFTDGLAMEGAKKFPNFCEKSLNAGVDILLDPITIDEQWNKLHEALKKGALSQELIDQKCRRVLLFKYALNCGVVPDKSMIDTKNATRLAKELYQESIVLLKYSQPFESSNIIAITNTKDATIAKVRQQIKSSKKPVTLVFYTTPYNMSAYKNEISTADNVILAHEDYVLAHEAVQNVIDGKVTARGQLCVELPGLFAQNEGIIPITSVTADTKQPEENIHKDIPEVDNIKLQEIDSLVNDGLLKDAFPGCQVLVSKDGNIVYNKSFGWFDDKKTKKVNNQSIYDLASVSKASATLAAFMIAVDEYGISINDKISKYIPKMRGTNKQNLTLRQALFHETGMRDGYPFYGMTIDSTSVNYKLYSSRRDATFCIQQDRGTWFNKNLQWNSKWVSPTKTSTHSLQIAEDMYIDPAFREEIVNKIIELPLKNVGGYRYSCLNFVLLRYVIEAKARKTLDSYLQEKLFLPLGLEYCSYNPLQNKNIDPADIVPTENDEAIRKQLLKGYVHDEIAAWSGGVEGNAGLFSNATDLAKILQLFLDNGKYEDKQIITTETCKLFTTTKSPKSRRGLGFDKPDMRNPDKSPCAEEVPASVYGHTGYTGTCFWVDPTNKMIYIFLSNRVNPTRTNNILSTESYRTKIQSVLYKALVK